MLNKSSVHCLAVDVCGFCNGTLPHPEKKPQDTRSHTRTRVKGVVEFVYILFLARN